MCYACAKLTVLTNDTVLLAQNCRSETRISSSRIKALWQYISMSYRGVRCGIFGALQDDGFVDHANFTHAEYILRI